MKRITKLLLFVAIGLFLSSCAIQPAGETQVSGRVLQYGIWQFMGPQRIESAPTTLSGMTVASPAERLIEQTRDVPARLGTHFGFRFEISGVASSGVVALRKVVKHPPIRNVRGVMETEYAVQFPAREVHGSISWFTGYLFNHPYELVPGTWTIDVWYRGIKAASQSFNVYKPHE
jgi:hypothetical protein